MEEYKDEIGLIEHIFSFKVKDNKAIVIGSNEKSMITEITHDYSTGQILLERRICEFRILHDTGSYQPLSEDNYKIWYGRQYYPKPDTLIGKMKNYLDRGY